MARSGPELSISSVTSVYDRVEVELRDEDVLPTVRGRSPRARGWAMGKGKQQLLYVLILYTENGYACPAPCP